MTRLCDPDLCGRSATPECDGSCEIATIRETPDLVRIYRSEWVVRFSSEKTGEEGEAECLVRFEEAYAGRVHQHNVRTRRVDPHDPGRSRSLLELRLPTMKGEFKTEALADEWTRKQPWATEGGVCMVVRNSKADHDLRAYGTRMLPTS